MRRIFISLAVIMALMFPLTVHAAGAYGIPDTKNTKIDELLWEFIKENVPEDAVWEEDVSINGNMALGWRNSVFDDMLGYCFSYSEEDVEKQIAIFDYVAEDRVYRADNVWIDINNVSIINASAKMYAYEDEDWKYIEDIEPYLQKKSHIKDGRLLVSGEQWENNYERSRLLIAVEVEKNLFDNVGYFYQTTIQKRHHNIIWIGGYPIEFYWGDAFKILLAAGGLCAVLVVSIKRKAKF